jgi:arsenite-transporting ATPase
LESQRELYQTTVKALADASTTTLILVSRPDLAALREADRCHGELKALGVNNQHLVINGVFAAKDCSDRVALALEARCQQALASMSSALAALPQTAMPLTSLNLLGIPVLRAWFQGQNISSRSDDSLLPSSKDATLCQPLPLETLLEDLAGSGHGIVVVAGKGGVGKTTIAAAIAVELAWRGHQVHLTTTDPAAHVEHTVESVVPGLRISRINPRDETRSYTQEVLAAAGAGLDPQGLALLQEDLRSPCTEEIAVFRAFAQAVAQGEEGFVIFDTAPTGHTILLLDAALAYHREVSRQTSSTSEAVKQLLPRLRDREFTRVLIVTLAEATPVHEAGRLQSDLIRAGIQPFAWIVNQSLASLDLRDPLLLARQRQEQAFIREVTELADRAGLVPWQSESPVGVEKLRALMSWGSRKPVAAPAVSSSAG